MNKSITLAIVGTTNHSLMSFAVEKTVENTKVDKIKIFSDKPIKCRYQYDFHRLPKKFDLFDYSNFILKSLGDYIDTDYVMIIQYDGFATNKNYFNETYFNYDFIGSYTTVNHPPLLRFLKETRTIDLATQSWYNIGGGFSLRSKKILDALKDDRIQESVYNYVSNSQHNCEDIFVTILYKDLLEKEYGITYAPADICLDFSSEILIGYESCLGFHGWENIPFHLTEEECIYYIKEYYKTNKELFLNSHRLVKLIGTLYYRFYFKVLEFLRNDLKIVF